MIAGADAVLFSVMLVFWYAAMHQSLAMSYFSGAYLPTINHFTGFF